MGVESVVVCKGCGGKGHYANQCPTANPNLKKGGGGKGWAPKGGFGWQRGRGKGKGKSAGKGKGGGLYELDLMGSWGGNWDQPQNWDPSQWEDASQGYYLRSLACLDRAMPTATANRFSALDDEIKIPIGQLIKVPRTQKTSTIKTQKLRLSTAWLSSKQCNHDPSECACIPNPEYPSLPCNGESPAPRQGQRPCRS